MAPPRLLPTRFGIVDTLVVYHQSGHLEHSLVDSAGDIYAATPSLHVAWALWCTLALYSVVRNLLLRLVLIAYPVVTTVVVVVTGNHCIIDAASGALLVGLTWTVLPNVGFCWSARSQRLIQMVAPSPEDDALSDWVATESDYDDTAPTAPADTASSGLANHQVPKSPADASRRTP